MIQRIKQLGALALLAATAWSQDFPRYQDLKYPPQRPVTLPEFQRITLPNGLEIELAEDRELPVVQGILLLPAGGWLEASHQIGLASLTGEVMRSGGIPGLDGDALDKRLEAIAASISVSFGPAMGSASFWCLSDQTEEILGLFAQVLMKPAFAEDKLELAKVRARTAISSRNDQPAEVARREMRKVLWGKDSPFARHPEHANIVAIGPDDLRRFHQGFVGPKGAKLAVIGDFDAKAMAEKLKSLFGGWTSAEDLPVRAMPISGHGPGGVYSVTKTGINQASIRLGHLSVGEDHPDYPALRLLSAILGEGFSSRLFKEVRSRLGLAYSVYGTFTAPAFECGAFLAGCDTKLETTAQALEAILREVKRIRDEKVSEEELTLAKDAMLNAWVFNFEKVSDIANRRLEDRFKGLPADAMETFRKKVASLTADELQRVAREHLAPEKLAILVVGDPARYERPLSDFGKVVEVDIAIPPPPTGAWSFSAEAESSGQALFAKVAAAHGGLDRLRAVKTMVGKGTFKQGPMAFGMTMSRAYPDKKLAVMMTPFGEFKMVVNGLEEAQMGGGEIQRRSVSPAEAEMSSLQDPNFFLQLDGLKLAHDGETLVAETALGNRVTLGLNEDGRIAWIRGTQDGVEATAKFSDYKDVDGLWLFQKMELATAGSPMSLIFEFKEYAVNPELDPTLFALPEAQK